MDNQNSFKFATEPTRIIVYPERIRNMWRMFGKIENTHCKTCVHLLRYPYHNRTYLKCNLNRQTHGAGTDWRAHWQACGKFEEKE